MTVTKKKKKKKKDIISRLRIFILYVFMNINKEAELVQRFVPFKCIQIFLLSITSTIF